MGTLNSFLLGEVRNLYQQGIQLFLHHLRVPVMGVLEEETLPDLGFVVEGAVDLVEILHLVDRVVVEDLELRLIQ